MTEQDHSSVPAEIDAGAAEAPHPPAVDETSPTAAEGSAESGAGTPEAPGPVAVEERADRAAEAPAAADAPARRSGPLRPRNMVIAGVAVAGVLAGAVFGPMAWQVWDEKDVAISTPKRVAGLVLDDSEGTHDTVDLLRTAIGTGVSLDHTVGAVYADESGEPRSVLFAGGTGVLVDPPQALDKSFALISDNAGGVEKVHEEPAGPLGGTVKCGTTSTDGNPMAVCGWADHGSLGVAMFPNRPVEQSAELLHAMRKAMQHRG